MKKKRGREGGRKKIKNSVFASVSAAFSLVSSLSSSYVFVVAQPGGGGAAGCVNPTFGSLPAAASLRQDTGCTYAAGTETYVDPGDSTKSKTFFDV